MSPGREFSDVLFSSFDLLSFIQFVSIEHTHTHTLCIHMHALVRSIDLVTTFFVITSEHPVKKLWYVKPNGSIFMECTPCFKIKIEKGVLFKYYSFFLERYPFLQLTV